MIIKQPSITVVYDRKKRANNSLPAPLELRVLYNYQQKYIATGIRLYPHQWKKGKITNCPDIMQISQILDTLIGNVRQILLDMMKEGIMDISSIQDRLDKLNGTKPTFIDFCRKRAEVRKYGKTKDSQERYDRFIRLFTEWGVIKDYDDITEENIIAYDSYLTGRKLKTYSRWNNYHRFLNSFIIDAIEAGHLKKNPYKWISIEKGYNTGIHKHLTPDEFNRIKKAKMPTESLERVRDIFIFQTYTCLSYRDLRSFNTDNIVRIKDMMVYTGRRQKTDIQFTIPLLPQALKILAKYNNRLPIISNAKYDDYLKLVAQAAGIDKPISSHWARHTGATLLLNQGVSMQVVSKICGHSSTRMTEQVYAKLLDETIINAMSKVRI